MKNKNSIAKITTPTASRYITADQFSKKFVEIETAMRMEEHGERSKIKEKLLATIDIVHELTDYGRHGFGYKEDGTIVAFSIPKGRPENMEERASEKEITLEDSLEWIEKFEFVAEQMGTCLQTRDGYLRWIKHLRSEISKIVTACPA